MFKIDFYLRLGMLIFYKSTSCILKKVDLIILESNPFMPTFASDLN